MLRGFLSILLIFCICLASSICFAEDPVFEYTLEKNKAIITGLNSNIKGSIDLVIPSTIDGYTVVGIADEAFSGRYFNSITIPDTTESIGNKAFNGTVVKQGQVIYIPESVEIIGTYAFSYMSGVGAFEVDPRNDYYTSEGGVLFNADKKELLNYPLGKQDGTYFLPEETMLLFCTSFGNCTNLKNLVLQNNEVMRMGYTFFGCDMSLYGDTGCYERLWMDELTDQYEYGKVKFGGTFEPTNSLIGDDNFDNRYLGLDDTLSVIVDGKKLNFDQEPIICNNRTLVPLRVIFEELGATITWYGNTQTVIAIKDNLVITLQVANDIMMVNNKSYILDAPAQLVNGRTLVPVRAISEAFGADVNWDKATKTVNIYTGKEVSLFLDNGKTVVTGWSTDELIEEMGRPNRKEISIYGLEWYVYNSDYNNFIMVAVDADKVCGFYTNSKGFSLNNSICYGCPSDIGLEKQRNVRITTYTDTHNDNTYHAVLVVLTGHEYEVDTASREFIYTQSIENFDATNAFRANYGVNALTWDEHAAKAAAGHSQDMADNNYFSHTSLDGRSLIDRYLDINKVSWQRLGENISAGRIYGIDTFGGWLNSEGHRENMLFEGYKYLGVGGGLNHDSTYNYYMTQVFITY